MPKYVQLFESFIFENEGKHSYGCAMVYFDLPELREMQKQIEKDDVYEDPNDPTYGLEKHPHVTLLYGLWKSVDPQEVKEVVQDAKFEPIELTKVTAFENEKYDVLKFDAKCRTLNALNKKLKEFPYTSKFDDYKAHCTIAYLQPGKAKKYIELFKGRKFTVHAKQGVYSEPDGEQIKFKVNLKDAE